MYVCLFVCLFVCVCVCFVCLLACFVCFLFLSLFLLVGRCVLVCFNFGWLAGFLVRVSAVPLGWIGG